MCKKISGLKKDGSAGSIIDRVKIQVIIDKRFKQKVNCLKKLAK